GTPAVTTRGMKEDDMKKVANWINETLNNKDNEGKLKNIKTEIETFCAQFPVPGIN
ncbi:serine hydroxymethyltransferase, partial [Candidatus Falkowbacteria bacterium CG10_big_fil_rev_8_21_14_0_10_37_6]